MYPLSIVGALLDLLVTLASQMLELWGYLILKIDGATKSISVLRILEISTVKLANVKSVLYFILLHKIKLNKYDNNLANGLYDYV